MLTLYVFRFPKFDFRRLNGRSVVLVLSRRFDSLRTWTTSNAKL